MDSTLHTSILLRNSDFKTCWFGRDGYVGTMMVNLRSYAFGG